MIEPAELLVEHLAEVRYLVGEFSLDFEEVPEVTVRIKLWKSSTNVGGDQYTYTVSHHIHTPTQAEPYYPSGPLSDSELGIARRAIRDIMLFYSGAVRAGHRPTAKWFVENSLFS